MKIDLKRIPRCKDASDENCIWELIVNGFVLGTYYGGAKKSYLEPEKWAKEMIKKRIPVIQRNIARLKKELEQWEIEKKAISED